MDQLVGECRTYSTQADTHYHTYAQLILPLQGRLLIETAALQCVLDEDHVFYLPPHCRHSFAAQDHHQFLVLDIPSMLIRSALMQPFGIVQHRPFDQRWYGLRSLLLAELAQKSSPTAATQSSPGLRHLVHYAASLLQSPQVTRSVEYIQTHFDQSFDLETLAQLEGFTVTYFCEWFKHQTGQTPKAYIQALRLKKAQELLTHTDSTILEIAQDVGYEHHGSLTRLFRQKLGLSPQQYRRQSRNSVKS